jgi:hypothetical protein
VHAALLCHQCPEVAAMLGLPEGWSFGLTNDGAEVRHGADHVVPLPTGSMPSAAAESKSN